MQNAKKRQEEEEESIRNILRTKDRKEMWRKVKPRKGGDEGRGKITVREWVEHFDSLLNIRYGERKVEWMQDRENIEVESLDGDITEGEVLQALKGMKGGTAPGVDGLPMKLLKTYARGLAGPLSKIFSWLFNSGKYPEQWSTAIIYPIWKSGNSACPNNYRGIALLSCVGKIFSKILTARLRGWVEGEGKLSEAQAGFRSKRSTMDQIFILDTIVRRRLQRKVPTYAAFIDLKKAFDSIDRGALWYKLARIGVSSKFVDILKEKYDKCRFCVRVGGKDRVSGTKKMGTGVMQGDQLSPLLFILFLDDLFPRIGNVDRGYAPLLGQQEVPVLAFADDLVLLSTSAGGLQRMLDELDRYCQEWNLRVNVGKTKTMVFETGRRWGANSRFYYAGERIEAVQSFRYLGVTVAKNGRWVAHAQEVRERARKACFGLARSGYKMRNFGLKLQLHFFEVLVAPILLYGSEVIAWNCPWECVESVFRTYGKRVLGLPRSSGNSGVELLLGRGRMEEEGQLRAISYWMKIRALPEERLLRIAYEYQRELVARGVDCWAMGVKRKLDKLGMGFIWEAQDGVRQRDRRRTKGKIRERMYDITYAKQLEEATNLKTCADYASFKVKPGIDPVLAEEKLFRKRQAYARLALKSTGGLINWDVIRTCKQCGTKLDENIFVHLVMVCDKLLKIRLEVCGEDWFIALDSLPASEKLAFIWRKGLRIKDEGVRRFFS